MKALRKTTDQVRHFSILACQPRGDDLFLQLQPQGKETVNRLMPVRKTLECKMHHFSLGGTETLF